MSDVIFPTGIPNGTPATDDRLLFSDTSSANATKDCAISELPITATQVGLGNVDNTSDATKNSAIATLTNKTLTAPVINSPTGIVKADVGLGNVDNTSDANKPISSATQTALDGKQATSEKGIANGYASLDSSGKVPSAQIPTGIGLGDVVGPASATDNNVVFFDGTTGKIIKDSGLTISGSNTGDQDLSSYVVGPASSTDNAIARFDSTTGKLIQDSSATIDDNGNISANNYRNILTDADCDTVTTAGSYGMIGTPTNGPIAGEFALQVYNDGSRIMQIAIMIDSTVWTRIYTGTWSAWIKTGIADADDVTLTGLATGDILQNIAGVWINNPVLTDTNSWTGFIDNRNITVSGDSTTRQVTLTHGTEIKYYWKGQEKSLGTSWTSDAHGTDTNQVYYLYSIDGTNFAWSTTPFDYSYVQVSLAFYDSVLGSWIYLREVHGTFPIESHLIDHNNIGTWRRSGGGPTASTYTLDTSTDAAITPGFDSSLIQDEDLSSDIPAWTEGTYTTAYTNGSNIMVFDTTNSFPFHYTPAGYINWYNSGVSTQGATLKFYNVYQILIPVASDVNSQKFRMIEIQPQAEYSTLASAIAEDIRGINLGNFSNLSPEGVFYTRLTYASNASFATTGKVQLTNISYVLGSRASQVSVSGINPTDHANLSNRYWTTALHTGDSSTIAGFDGSGVASLYTLSGTGTEIITSDLGDFTGEVTTTYTNLRTKDVFGTNSLGILAGGVLGANRNLSIMVNASDRQIDLSGNLTVSSGGATVSGTNTGDQTSIVGISGTIAEFNTACSDADFATTANISDTAYGAGWNGDTTNAPSKNAVYDKIESISSGGVTIKNGQGYRAAATASGTENIAHGLGATPKYISISACQADGVGYARSLGSYDGTTNSCEYNGGVPTAQNSFIIWVTKTATAGDAHRATVSAWDATNFTLNWTKLANGAEVQFTWTAFS